MNNGRPKSIEKSSQDYIITDNPDQEIQKLKGVLLTAGSVCHEMNQPLQVLMGITTILKMNIKNPSEKTLESLDIISDQVDRLAGITRKLQRIKRVKTMYYPSAKEDAQILDLDASVNSD